MCPMPNAARGQPGFLRQLWQAGGGRVILKFPGAPSSVALALAGTVLIAVGFFLLIPEEQRSAVAWLDLVVCELVFLIDFSALPIGIAKTNGFSRQIPKLGILWTTHITYTVLALAGVRWGWLLDLPRNWQFMYQVAVLFGLLVILSVAERATEHAASVEDVEQVLASSLDRLKTAFAECDATFGRLGGLCRNEYDEFLKIKDDVRYLSPSDAKIALETERQMAAVVSDISASLPVSGRFLTANENIHEKLAMCRALMRQRKQERRLGQAAGGN